MREDAGVVAGMMLDSQPDTRELFRIRDVPSAVDGRAVFTGDSNILYGSVRTRMIFSSEPGTCQGAFFYKSDKAG